MPDSLVQPLFNGSLDIIGDVHGEIEALSSLLHHLGYDATWRHPGDRRLVFFGDLTDRGPDTRQGLAEGSISRRLHRKEAETR